MVIGREASRLGHALREEADAEMLSGREQGRTCSKGEKLVRKC